MPSETEKQPAVQTMQDDLVKTNPPSRFDLRHRKPLPKSEKMEDLRQTKKEDTTIDYPQTPPKNQRTLKEPQKRETTIWSNPIFLWTSGITLSGILLTIILAITVNALS